MNTFQNHPDLSPRPSLCCEQTLAATGQVQHPPDKRKDRGRGAGTMQGHGRSCHSARRSRPPTQRQSRAASLPSWDPRGQPAGRAGPRRSGGQGLRQRLRSRPVGTWWALLGRPGPDAALPPSPASTGSGSRNVSHPVPVALWAQGTRPSRQLGAREQRPASLWACRFLFSLRLSFLIARGGRRGGTEVFKPQLLAGSPLHPSPPQPAVHGDI